MVEKNDIKKCYTTFSCVASILIILFVLGAIVWDLFITKPQIKRNITEIKSELVNINKKLELRDSILILNKEFDESIKNINSQKK